KFTVPSNMGGSADIKVISAGRSLLTPKMTFYNASQQQLATVNGVGQYDTTLTLTQNLTPAPPYHTPTTHPPFPTSTIATYPPPAARGAAAAPPRRSPASTAPSPTATRSSASPARTSTPTNPVTIRRLPTRRHWNASADWRPSRSRVKKSCSRSPTAASI